MCPSPALCRCAHPHRVDLCHATKKGQGCGSRARFVPGGGGRRTYAQGRLDGLPVPPSFHAGISSTKRGGRQGVNLLIAPFCRLRMVPRRSERGLTPLSCLCRLNLRSVVRGFPGKYRQEPRGNRYVRNWKEDAREE